MGKSIPITIGDIEFSSRTNAKEFYSAIRDKYIDGVKIDAEDENHLRNLIQIHSECEEKNGSGIDFFTVETDDVFKRTRHFYIHRTDKTGTDFSFREAIDGPNTRRDRLNALRQAIKGQIIDFKNRNFDQTDELYCPLTNLLITRRSYHVDHMPPYTFQQLVDGWLVASSVRFECIEITASADNQYVAEMTNREQRESWTAYHKEYARLRLLSPKGNLSSRH